MENFTEALIERIFSNVEFDAVTMEAAKINIADTIICGILGRNASGIPEIIDWVDSLSSSGKSSIWRCNKRVPPSLAALCNASMSHALDFDDTHDVAILHAGVGCIPAALALSEQIPSTTGKALIRAIIWGVETSSLLGLATPEGPAQSGWMLTALYSYFASVVSSSCILGLDKEQLNHALGIVFSNCAGNALCVRHGALTKRLQPGFGNQAGVMAAELARRGITGPLNVFEGKMGVFDQYHKISLLDNYAKTIGSPFQITQLSYKPYPCCRCNHAPIDAAIKLHRRLNNIELLNAVDRVEVFLSQTCFESVFSPLDRKQKPKSIVDAQFSSPYTVSTALLTGNVVPADFSEKACFKGVQLPLAEKVYPIVQPGQNERSVSGAKVVVKLINGEVYEEEVQMPTGQPGDIKGLWELVWNKLQMTDIERKEDFFSTLRMLEQIDKIETLTKQMG